MLISKQEIKMNEQTANLIIGGTTVLVIVVLCTLMFFGLKGLAKVFSDLKLTILDPKWGGPPLGLPQGSIRALLAFLLLIVFVTSSVAIYVSENAASPKYLEAVSPRMAEAFGNQIVAIAPNAKDPTLFDITIRDRNQFAQHFADRYFIAVSTIMASIFAYYFATRGAANDILTDAFRPAPANPKIDKKGVNPSETKADTQVEFEVGGTGFRQGLRVELTDSKQVSVVPTEVTVESSKKIKLSAKFPTPGTTVDIKVINADGTVDTLRQAITVKASDAA